jgi:hypothetical protein
VGAIDYTVTNTALSGTFYFYHYNFTGGSLSTGPNNLSVSGSDLDVQLWGNDQMKSMGSNVAPSMLRGIDLRFAAQVPDGGLTAGLLGMAFLTVCVGRINLAQKTS